MNQHLADRVWSGEVKAGRISQERQAPVDRPLHLIEPGQAPLDDRLCLHQLASDPLLLLLEFADAHGVGEVGLFHFGATTLQLGDPAPLEADFGGGLLSVFSEASQQRLADPRAGRVVNPDSSQVAQNRVFDPFHPHVALGTTRGICLPTKAVEVGVDRTCLAPGIHHTETATAPPAAQHTLEWMRVTLWLIASPAAAAQHLLHKLKGQFIDQRLVTSDRLHA